MQDTQELSQSETALQSPTAALNIPPSKPPIKADRPPAQAPPIEPKPEGTPSAQAADISKPSSEAPQEMPDALVVGAWMLGMLSGGQFNADTGKYEGGASGMGQIYTFKADGTYSALIFGNTIWLTSNYSIGAGVLTLTGRMAEESEDDGKTWSAPEILPDASSLYVVGTDEAGTYLLLGEEGATPPLVEKKNAMKYKLTD